MGMHADGQICFGILLEEETELPWNDSDGEEAWWRSVNGYVAPFTPYTLDGSYAEGWGPKDPRFEEYFAHQRAWEKEHPLPFEMVNACHYDYPVWILAEPDSMVRARQGSPEALLEDMFSEDMDAYADRLVQFCKTHGIEFEGKPKWYLSGCWG